jgi:hypothetical protein
LVKPPELGEDSECVVPPNMAKIIKIDLDEQVNKTLEEIRDEVADSSGMLTTTNAIQHCISLAADPQPIKEKQHKVPHKPISVFKKCIQETEKDGLIRSSWSPWCAPVNQIYNNPSVDLNLTPDSYAPNIVI